MEWMPALEAPCEEALALDLGSLMNVGPEPEPEVKGEGGRR